MSFASGFFNTAADRVTERKKYIRDKNAKDRDYLMTYGTQAVRKTEEEANKAITIGKLLEGRGMTKENINFLVDTSGPQGLAIFYNTIKDFKPNELSTKQLNEYVIMAEDYRPSGTTYNDMIKKSFGLYKNSVTDNPEKNEERGMWSFLGLDANAANSSMTDTYAGGYSGYDYKRIMGSSAPSLKAPLPVDRSLLPRIYSPTDYGRIFNSIEAEILVQGDKYVKGMSEEMLETLTPKSPEYKKYTVILEATKNKDTRTLLRELPDAIQAVMDYETKYPGSLNLNPEFAIQHPSFSFGEDAQQIITGKNIPIKSKEGLSLEAQYSALTSDDEDATPFSLLLEFETKEEANKSKDLKLGDYVIIGGQLTTADLDPDKVVTTPLDVVEAMKDIMDEWEKDNPKPAPRLGQAALKFWETKRDRYSVKEQNKLTESQEPLPKTSDVTGSIVDTDQEAFDKEIRKLVDERLLKTPKTDPNDIATMVAYKVRRTNPKYKDLNPTKIQKD